MNEFTDQIRYNAPVDSFSSCSSKLARVLKEQPIFSKLMRNLSYPALHSSRLRPVLFPFFERTSNSKSNRKEHSRNEHQVLEMMTDSGLNKSVVQDNGPYSVEQRMHRELPRLGTARVY